MNESQFTSLFTQTKNLEISVKMFVGECYHYTHNDSHEVAVTLATELLSNVIPLQYLVKQYYYNRELDYFNDVSKQILRHLNLIDEALVEVSNEGFFIHDELHHVLNQLIFTRKLMNDLLVKKEPLKKEDDGYDELVGF